MILNMVMTAVQRKEPVEFHRVHASHLFGDNGREDNPKEEDLQREPGDEPEDKKLTEKVGGRCFVARNHNPRLEISVDREGC
ncbi:hypothetical protein R1flu_024569 [Riccia fluitans]|uniref:Uncharacterized protein n=1 Tax=Riccia fluitans TaxID=41844 RepID=A0ABD1XV89_9MARC